MSVDLDSSPERIALSSDSDRSDIGTPPSQTMTADFMESEGFDILKLFPSAPSNPMKSKDITQLFPSPPSEADITSLFPTPPGDAVHAKDIASLFPTVPSDGGLAALFPLAPGDKENSLDMTKLFPSPPSDQVDSTGSSLSYDPEEMRFQEEVIQYVKDGHLPPTGQAYKIRKKENGVERSLVILSNGTIFATGKNPEFFSGKLSIPGGKESEFIAKGHDKWVLFSDESRYK